MHSRRPRRSTQAPLACGQGKYPRSLHGGALANEHVYSLQPSVDALARMRHPIACGGLRVSDYPLFKRSQAANKTTFVWPRPAQPPKTAGATWSKPPIRHGASNPIRRLAAVGRPDGAVAGGGANERSWKTRPTSASSTTPIPEPATIGHFSGRTDLGEFGRKRPNPWGEPIPAGGGKLRVHPP